MEEAFAELSRYGPIELMQILDMMSNKLYRDLDELIHHDVNSTMERQRQRKLMDVLYHNRQRFLRLILLLRWFIQGSEATKTAVTTIGRTNAHLGSIEGTSLKLFQLSDSMSLFKLPLYSVPHAVDALKTGDYTRLPRNIEGRLPKHTPNEDTICSALQWLNRRILTRTADEEMPQGLTSITLERGRLRLLQDGLFSLSVTVSDSSPKAPWRLLGVDILVNDPLVNCASSAPQPLQRLVSVAHIERIHGILAHMLEVEATSNPLSRCCAISHRFCSMVQLNVIYTQAVALERGRLQGVLGISAAPAFVRIDFWPRFRDFALDFSEYLAEKGESPLLTQPSPFPSTSCPFITFQIVSALEADRYDAADHYFQIQTNPNLLIEHSKQAPTGADSSFSTTYASTTAAAHARRRKGEKREDRNRYLSMCSVSRTATEESLDAFRTRVAHRLKEAVSLALSHEIRLSDVLTAVCGGTALTQLHAMRLFLARDTALAQYCTFAINESLERPSLVIRFPIEVKVDPHLSEEERHQTFVTEEDSLVLSFCEISGAFRLKIGSNAFSGSSLVSDCAREITAQPPLMAKAIAALIRKIVLKHYVSAVLPPRPFVYVDQETVAGLDDVSTCAGTTQILGFPSIPSVFLELVVSESFVVSARCIVVALGDGSATAASYPGGPSQYGKDLHATASQSATVSTTAATTPRGVAALPRHRPSRLGQVTSASATTPNPSSENAPSSHSHATVTTVATAATAVTTATTATAVTEAAEDGHGESGPTPQYAGDSSEFLALLLKLRCEPCALRTWQAACFSDSFHAPTSVLFTVHLKDSGAFPATSTMKPTGTNGNISTLFPPHLQPWAARDLRTAVTAVERHVYFAQLFSITQQMLEHKVSFLPMIPSDVPIDQFMQREMQFRLYGFNDDSIRYVKEGHLQFSPSGVCRWWLKLNDASLPKWVSSLPAQKPVTTPATNDTVHCDWGNAVFAVTTHNRSACVETFLQPWNAHVQLLELATQLKASYDAPVSLLEFGAKGLRVGAYSPLTAEDVAAAKEKQGTSVMATEAQLLTGSSSSDNGNNSASTNTATSSATSNTGNHGTHGGRHISAPTVMGPVYIPSGIAPDAEDREKPKVQGQGQEGAKEKEEMPLQAHMHAQTLRTTNRKLLVVFCFSWNHASGCFDVTHELPGSAAVPSLAPQASSGSSVARGDGTEHLHPTLTHLCAALASEISAKMKSGKKLARFFEKFNTLQYMLFMLFEGPKRGFVLQLFSFQRCSVYFLKRYMLEFRFFPNGTVMFRDVRRTSLMYPDADLLPRLRKRSYRNLAELKNLKEFVSHAAQQYEKANMASVNLSFSDDIVSLNGSIDSKFLPIRGAKTMDKLSNFIGHLYLLEALNASARSFFTIKAASPTELVLEGAHLKVEFSLVNYESLALRVTPVVKLAQKVIDTIHQFFTEKIARAPFRREPAKFFLQLLSLDMSTMTDILSLLWLNLSVNFAMQVPPGLDLVGCKSEEPAIRITTKESPSKSIDTEVHVAFIFTTAIQRQFLLPVVLTLPGKTLRLWDVADGRYPPPPDSVLQSARDTIAEVWPQALTQSSPLFSFGVHLSQKRPDLVEKLLPVNGSRPLSG